METQQIYEIVGYIASILIAISLLMRSILKLRVINLIGAVFFTVYGLLIQAYPVAAVNFTIVLIDIYYLAQMLSTREFFRLLEVNSDSEYLRAFLDFYKEDIRRFQPEFSYDPQRGQLIFFILRNMVPTGLMIGEIQHSEARGGSVLHVLLDYAIPGYRDLKIGRFLFQQHMQAFRERGIRAIYTRPGAPAHASYLRQIGFQPEGQESESTPYCLTITP